MIRVKKRRITYGRWKEVNIVLTSSGFLRITKIRKGYYEG